MRRPRRPRQSCSSAGLQLPELARPSCSTGVQDHDGKCIVLVDDESSFTQLMASFLSEHFACPVRAFTQPLALIDELPRLNIGMLVTDYYMPRVNGFELIRRVSQQRPLTPCILITGHRLDEDDEDAPLPPEIKALLPKPFRWQELAHLIQKHWPADTPLRLQDNADSLHG